MAKKRENKTWYYWQNPNDKKWYILAFVNGQGSCSLRRWEAKTGDSLPKQVIKGGDWQDKFAEYLYGTSFRIHLSHQPNLEKDCKSRLPHEVLLEIKEQITQLHISLSLILLDC